MPSTTNPENPEPAPASPPVVSRWPRWTTRSLMIGLALIALAFGLARPAVEVFRFKDRHVHVGLIRLPDDEINARMTYSKFASFGHAAPFWPRYWRRLVGLPWNHLPVCGLDPLIVEESCEFARPEIASHPSPGTTRTHSTPEMRAEMARANAEWAARHGGPKTEGRDKPSMLIGDR